LNSSDYGVPQHRRRFFLIATKKNKFEFPSIIKQNRNLADAISDLPKIESGESSKIPNHVAMNHTSQMLDKMSFVKEGGNRESIPESIRPKSGDARKYIRLNREEPSYCVTGDMRKVFHYEQNRALTVRELARVQTFPDNFVFLGPSISQQQQVGNSVPVDLAYLLAKSIREVL
jgi:DNA (cytosine-5)-methyltransferase 1